MTTIRDAETRFSTILVARSNNARPSDVEVHLRQHCQKMRVSSQLNGAHMILPQEHSLALRVYSAQDLQKLDKSDSSSTTSDEDPDGILSFTRKFQWSLVFFVLPNASELLDQQPSSSFLHRALRLTDAASDNSQPPRILVLANTEQVITSIISFADALTAPRAAARDKYVRRIRAANFCNGDANDDENAAASQVAEALREFGDRMEFPVGEADILLRLMGNLGNLVAAASDAKLLANIPVEDRTKRTLLQFFSESSSESDDSAEPEVTPEEQQDNRILLSPPPFATGMMMNHPHAGMYPHEGVPQPPPPPPGNASQLFNNDDINYQQQRPSTFLPFEQAPPDHPQQHLFPPYSEEYPQPQASSGAYPPPPQPYYRQHQQPPQQQDHYHPHQQPAAGTTTNMVPPPQHQQTAPPPSYQQPRSTPWGAPSRPQPAPHQHPHQSTYSSTNQYHQHPQYQYQHQQPPSYGPPHVGISNSYPMQHPQQRYQPQPQQRGPAMRPYM